MTLRRGRQASTARLVEVPIGERPPLLRQLIRTSSRSVANRFVTNGLADAPTPDAVAAAADRIAVFKLEPTGRAARSGMKRGRQTRPPLKAPPMGSKAGASEW